MIFRKLIEIFVNTVQNIVSKVINENSVIKCSLTHSQLFVLFLQHWCF